MTLRQAEPRTKRWTREEYYRLAEQGYFDGKRVQLIDGKIIEMPAQGHAHVRAVTLLSRWAMAAFDPKHWVRTQMPLNVGRRSDPEPDICVAREALERYKDHPTTALLVIEVSDRTLRLDRRKTALYAGANVDEYWIVNLRDKRVELHRGPNPEARTYADVSQVTSGPVAPSSRADAPIDVSELFI
jgi:Uma2 family endonuclease